MGGECKLKLLRLSQVVEPCRGCGTLEEFLVAVKEYASSVCWIPGSCIVGDGY